MLACITAELMGSNLCRSSAVTTIISIPGLMLNYASAKALCSRHNGTILSETSFRNSCSVGLTDVYTVSWRGLQNANNKAFDTNGRETDLAQRLGVVCEIRKSVFN